MAGGEVDGFQFQDYREFLRAYYAERKTHAKISYRAFSRRAGLGSPNYLKLVMDGARNLSPAMAGRFAAAAIRPRFFITAPHRLGSTDCHNLRARNGTTQGRGP